MDEHIIIPEQFAGIKTKNLDKRVALQLARKAKQRTMTEYIETLVLQDLERTSMMESLLQEMQLIRKEISHLTREVSRFQSAVPYQSARTEAERETSPLQQVSDDQVFGEIDADDLEYSF